MGGFGKDELMLEFLLVQICKGATSFYQPGMRHAMIPSKMAMQVEPTCV